MEKENEIKRYRTITPHGEADVEEHPDGKRYIHPLKTEPLADLPSWFRESYAIELKLFHSLLMYIKKHQPNRNLPVTRKEFMKSGADPVIISKLVEAGLLRPCMLPSRNAAGRNTGSRSCFYYTDQGRAFIRAKLDPTYAITENT